MFQTISVIAGNEFKSDKTGRDSFMWRWGRNYGLFFVIFLFWFCVAVCVPEGGDDWEIPNWYIGTDSLMGGAARSWSSFNGRVCANLFTEIFSYHRTLWYAGSAFIHTFTLFLISRLLSFDKNKLAVLAAFLGSIMLSNGFRAEIQFYLVANVAYTFCTCGMFALIYMLERNYKGERFLSSKIFSFALWAIYALCMSLWIENLTLALCAVIAIYNLRFLKEKRYSVQMLGATAGTLAGSIFLLSSPGVERRIDGSMTLIETIRVNYRTVLQQLVLDNLNLYCLLSVAVLFLVFTRKIKMRTIQTISLLLCMLTLAVTAIDRMKGGSLLYGQSGLPAVFISCVVLLHIFILACYSLPENGLLMEMYVMAFISAAPMVLSPGNRNMILAIWIVIGFIGYFISKFEVNNHELKLFIYLMVFGSITIRLMDYAYVLKDAVVIENIRQEVIREYKVKSLKPQTEEDFILILPCMDEKYFIGNFNAVYYKSGIINHFKLPENTRLYFDDGLSANSIFIVMDQGIVLAEIDQYIKTGDNFIYQFSLQKDGVPISTVEKKVPKCNFHIYDRGQYQVLCTITNQNTQKQKTLLSEPVPY